MNKLNKMTQIPEIVKKITIIVLLLITFTLTGSAGLVTPCTNVCTIGDSSSGAVNYVVDHNSDQIEFMQAINQVALYGTASNKGQVIVKQTAQPYSISSRIYITQENFVIRGETPNVQIFVAGNGGSVFFVENSKSNIEIKNFKINGNAKNLGICCGLGRFRAIMFNDGGSNYVVENIEGDLIADDLIWGKITSNYVFRNLKYTNSGHSGTYLLGTSTGIGNANGLIENVYCRDIGNACIRYTEGRDSVIRNVYALDTAAQFSTEYAVELNMGDDLNPRITNMYFENITAIDPLFTGIWLMRDQSDHSSLFRINNITFKNAFVDCKEGCNYDTGDGTSNDRPAGIRVQGATNVVFDDVTVQNGNKDGFRFTNYHTSPSIITVRNSQILGNNRYGMYLYSGLFNLDINHNNFWDNTVANTYGNIQLGAGNTYNNPGGIVEPTVQATVNPTPTVSQTTIPPTAQPTAQPTGTPTTGNFPIADTSIKSGQPNLDRGGIVWIDVGGLSGGGNGNYRGLLMFDIPRTSQKTIKSAILRLKYDGRSVNTNIPTAIGIYRPSTSWSSSSTWNSFSPVGGSWLDRNGVNFGNAPYAEAVHPLGSTADLNLDVTTLVQQYTDGTYPNTGFLIKANEVENSYIAFHSSEASENLRPLLTIEYAGTNVDTNVSKSSAGSISVSSNPPNAQIIVNEKPMGVTNRTGTNKITLPATPFYIRIIKDGFKPITDFGVIIPGKTIQKTYNMQPVSQKNWFQAWLDGILGWN